MTKPFFTLEATSDPLRFRLPVVRDLCVGVRGDDFLMGGVGLASGISAMQWVMGWPVIWSTAQYLSFARPGDVVDLEVKVAVQGKYTGQARASGRVGDREIFTVNGAFGGRPSDLAEQWVTAPVVPGPEDCAPAGHWHASQENLHARIEFRPAKGRYSLERTGQADGDGHSIYWIRPKGDFEIDSLMVAILADFMPSAIGDALKRPAAGTSLDNTLRIRHVVPTGWLLCDIQVHGLHHGVGHGAMRLFAQSGELIATASQSFLLRVFDGGPG